MDYTIKLAAERTGLSQHAIRAWERRYGAVKPSRSSGRHRLYTDEDIERLELLRSATEAGHSIRNIATLPTAKLKSLAIANGEPIKKAATAAGEGRGRSFVEEGVHAVQSLNAPAFDGVLSRASVKLGQQGLIRHVLAPLVQAVGELWRDGSITAAHEHFASALVRTFLTSSSKPFAAGQNRPNLLVATPAGQLHELGAILAAATAVNDGWAVTYLGSSLPAAEIAGAALQSHALAVALSIVYPEDDPGLPQELERLRGYVGPDVALLVGGRAAGAYREVLDGIGALVCRNLEELDRFLAKLRQPRRKATGQDSGNYR